MTDQVYRQLLDVMRRRGGLYPGLDIPEFYALVENLFTPEEAAVNNAMPSEPFTASQIAQELRRTKKEVENILQSMADKGLCSTFQKRGIRYFKAEPMMPGILEFQLMPGKSTDREKKIARLIHDFKRAYEAAQGPIKLTYPSRRVITVDRTVASRNTIHTYDQVSTYIDKNRTIAVATCFCRHLAALLKEDTHGMPIEVCIWFGRMADFAIERLGARALTKEEARTVLRECEEAGLVHMSANITDDVECICNCDRWHCRVIRMVLEQPKPAQFFNSGFRPQVDSDLCETCGTCVDRCPASALTIGEDDLPQVDLDRCFGCAVCATGCPSTAIGMQPKPGYPKPPKDMPTLIAALNRASG